MAERNCVCSAAVSSSMDSGEKRLLYTDARLLDLKIFDPAQKFPRTVKLRRGDAEQHTAVDLLRELLRAGGNDVGRDVLLRREAGHQRDRGGLCAAEDEADAALLRGIGHRDVRAAGENKMARGGGFRRGEDGGNETVLHHLTVVQYGDMVAHALHHAHLVRDDDDRDAELFIDVADQLEDLARGLWVERARRLVAQQDLGVRRQRAGNGDALLLTAGELRRIGLRLVGQTDRLQKLLRARSRLTAADPGKLHREADIIQTVPLHEQIEALEDHGNVAPRSTKLRGRHGIQTFSVDDDLAGGGALEHIDAAHQRALAGAAHADDAVNVTVRNGQGDILEGFHPPTGSLKDFTDVLEFDQGILLLSFILLQGIQRGLLAAVETHGLDVNGSDGDDVGAVFLVEVIKIGGVLEVIGVHGAVLHDGVGHNVVVVGLNVEGDVLFGKDLLGDLEDLGVGRGGGGDGDGFAGERGVVDTGVVAVARILDGAHDRTVILLGDVIGDLLALERGDQSLDLVAGLVAFLDGEDVGVSGGGAFNGQRILDRIQTSVDGVVGVDDGVVHILEDVGDLRSFGLNDLDVVGILGDVVLGGGDAGAVLELDDAVGFEQQQGAGFVGGVVGDCDLNGGVGLFAAAGENTEGENCREGKRNELFHDFILPFLDFDII